MKMRFVVPVVSVVVGAACAGVLAVAMAVTPDPATEAGSPTIALMETPPGTEWTKPGDMQVVWLHELSGDSIYWTSDAASCVNGEVIQGTDTEVKLGYTSFEPGTVMYTSDDGDGTAVVYTVTTGKC